MDQSPSANHCQISLYVSRMHGENEPACQIKWAMETDEGASPMLPENQLYHIRKRDPSYVCTEAFPPPYARLCS